MDERIHFFDAIESNKRKSLILMGAMLFLSFVLCSFIFYYITGEWAISVFISIIISAGYIYLSYNSGTKLILQMSNAKKASKQDNPYLFNVVEGLAVSAQIPMPEIYIIDDPSPNAFATGKDPSHSAVAVTTGLLKELNNRELSAVMAHEISHIANYDIRYMVVAVAVVGFISIIGYFFSRSLLFSGGGSKKGGAIIIIGIVFAILAPIFAELVRFAISREREYLADANGARLIRDPSALASALEKISKISSPVKNANPTTAPMYFSNPLKKSAIGLFASHPPVEKRIERLNRM
ncbi:MAG: M48 family metalloprotease [Candidatus Micrarchaeia archaeon]